MNSVHHTHANVGKPHGLVRIFHFWTCVTGSGYCNVYTARFKQPRAHGNIAFVLCSSVVEAPIFFPVQNGANMIFGAIAALFFKEKLSAKTAVGIAVGVVAALLLNL